VDGVAQVVGAERHAQEVHRGSRRPQARGIDVVDPVDAEQAVQVQGPAVLVGGRGDREPQRGHGSRRGLEQGRRRQVRGHRDVDRGRRARVDRDDARLPDRDADVHVVRLVEPVGEDVDDGDAELPERRAGGDR
jgi:hypothetical protein